MAANEKFIERLEAEMERICGHDLPDLNSATTEEMVRATLRILTGNGKPMHGLIAKTASIGLYVEDIQMSVHAMSGKLDNQIKRCDEVQVQRQKEQAVREAVKGVRDRVREQTAEQKQAVTASPVTTVNVGTLPADKAAGDNGQSGGIPAVVGRFVLTNWRTLAVLIALGIFYMINMSAVNSSVASQQQAITRLEQTLTQLTAAVNTGREQPDGNDPRTIPHK